MNTLYKVTEDGTAINLSSPITILNNGQQPAYIQSQIVMPDYAHEIIVAQGVPNTNNSFQFVVTEPGFIRANGDAVGTQIGFGAYMSINLSGKGITINGISSVNGYLFNNCPYYAVDAGAVVRIQLIRNSGNDYSWTLDPPPVLIFAPPKVVYV